MNSFDAFSATLHASARLYVLRAFASLNSLEFLVGGSDPVNALAFAAALTRLDAFVSLDSLDALARFDSLDALTGLDALEALACLDPLDCFPRLDAPDTLHAFAAHIAELLLKLRILELHVTVMSWVKFPVLELATAGIFDLIKLAVEHGVGLDRRKAAISPIVVVIQRGPSTRADTRRMARMPAPSSRCRIQPMDHRPERKCNPAPSVR